jgi:hypothetical protein
MPQEAPTMRMLVESGLAEELNRPQDIVSIVDQMAFPVRRQALLPEQYQLDLTDRGVFDIARSLLELANPEVERIEAIEDVA